MATKTTSAKKAPTKARRTSSSQRSAKKTKQSNQISSPVMLGVVLFTGLSLVFAAVAFWHYG